MSFTALDLPDQNASLAGWLEDHLAGLDLADVVAGLEAFRSSSESSPALDDVLQGQQPSLLERGLAVLSESKLQALLRHPRLLLPLQELVLTQGGSYWRNRPLNPDHQDLVETLWPRIERQVSPAATRRDSPGGGIAARHSAWAKVLTVAAVLMVGFFGWRQWQSPPSAAAGWGWDRPGALAANVSAPDYLRQLAAGANDWFNQRPQDQLALRTRLQQFQHGCDTLLAAPHTPLAAADREWLLERCRAWRGKIDGHLAALDAGTPLTDVLTAADETVNKLRTALTERAATLG
jgi:hypothetical protein